MAKLRLDHWLDGLERVRESASPDALQYCLQAVEQAPGAAVARAMALLRRLGHEGHGGQAALAFERLCADGLKADPGCLGRMALLEGLLALDWPGPEPWWSGLHLVQWEPVWGGRVDTAAGLRGLCALGLLRSADARAPLALAILLADRECEARQGAVRALREAPESWALPLLAHRAVMGVEELDAQLDLLHGLLEREQAQAFQLVAAQLQSESESSREAAAIALGERGGPEGAGLLWDFLDHNLLPQERRAAWIGLALSRCAEGREALLDQIATMPAVRRREVAEALSGLRDADLELALSGAIKKGRRA